MDTTFPLGVQGRVGFFTVSITVINNFLDQLYEFLQSVTGCGAVDWINLDQDNT
jgi:hypothetical protein